MRQPRFIARSDDLEALKDYISSFYAGLPVTLVGQRIYVRHLPITQTRVIRSQKGWRFEQHPPEDAPFHPPNPDWADEMAREICEERRGIEGPLLMLDTTCHLRIARHLRKARADGMRVAADLLSRLAREFPERADICTEAEYRENIVIHALIEAIRGVRASTDKEAQP